MPETTIVETVTAPSPWRVSDRNHPKSMFPIRDAEGKVVAYAYRQAVAERIVKAINAER